MRAVGEGVDGVFAIRQNRGAVDFFEAFVGASERRFANRRVGVLAEIKFLQREGTFEAVDFRVTGAVRLDRFARIFYAGDVELLIRGVEGQRPLDCGASPKAEEVDVAVFGRDFVERDRDFGVFVHFKLEAEETAVVGAEVDDLRVPGLVNGVDRERFRVGVERRVEALNFVRKNDFKFVELVAFEFRADVDERTVAPRLFELFAARYFAGRAPSLRLDDRELRLRDAAREVFDRRLLGEFDAGRRAETGKSTEVVDFDERTLEAEALRLLETRFVFDGDKRAFGFAGVGRGENVSGAVDDFRLQERRLVEVVIAVRVVTGDFDRDVVFTRFQEGAELPFVDAEPTMRAARRAVTGEFVVDADAHNRRAGRAENDIFRRFRVGDVERRDKNERNVHFLFATGGPNRNRFNELRGVGALRFRIRRGESGRRKRFERGQAAERARA